MSPFTREAIRARPGMYVGDVYDGSGVVHMLWEVVGNAVDQYLAGRCSRIEVVLHESFAVTIRDDGPGIPPERIERALSGYHDRATLEGHAPHVHLDGSGVGLFPVAAVSQAFEIESRHAGKAYVWTLEEGVPVGPLTSREDHRAPGTSIRFAPDPSIFATRAFPRDDIRRGLRDLADLAAGLEVILRDEGLTMRAPEGLVERIRRLAPEALHVMSRTESVGDARVEVALGWEPWARAPRYEGFANLQLTRDGGTHVAGLRKAVRGLGRDDAEREAVEAGVVGVVGVLLPEVKYGGPTRDKLVSEEARPLVRAVTQRMLTAYFDARPTAVGDLVARFRHTTR